LGIFRRDGQAAQQPTPARSRLTASAPRGGRLPSQLPANSVFRNPNLAAAEPASFAAPRALTAAAVQVKMGDKTEADQFKARRSAASSLWQQEAWEYYDAIGEVKYAFNLVASVVSRIRLYAALNNDPSEAPIPIRLATDKDRRLGEAAERALERLDSAYGGQAGLLRDAALNIQVAGECYLVQVPERPGHGLPETWDIRSVDELVMDQKGNLAVAARREYTQSTGASGSKNTGAIPLPKNAFVGRIWRAHPRFSEEADSSLRGQLDLCAELLLLNRTFRSTARSRLNAGALYLPDGLSVASGGDPAYPLDDADGIYDGPTPEEMEDEFEDQLIDAMTTPIRDEDSASAVVPLIIRGPAELGDKIKQFKFERSFDPALAARSDRVLERIMQGLDVPKDMITGLANVKYANALQIDESLYKAHIEPLMLMLVDAFTVVYLRPYLLANGFAKDEVDRVVVWFDPSLIATRNDRAMDADAGFDRMAVSLDTWRRAHGFSEQDAPSPTELGLRLLVEKGALTPELSESLLTVVAPDIMKAARQASMQQSGNAVPPEVDQLLAQATGLNQGGAPAAPTEATPAPEAAAPAAPTAPETPAQTAPPTPNTPEE